MIIFLSFVSLLTLPVFAYSASSSAQRLNGETEEDYTLPPLPTLPSVGVCQTYSGKLCEDFLKDSYVFVPPNKTVHEVEQEISTVFNIFQHSK